MTPLTDYINNTIYEELLDKPDYNSDTSNESIYLDLRIIAGYTTEMEKLERKNSKINLVIQLEKAATKNLRSRIWAYSLGVYLYVLSWQELTLHHKTYSILQEEGDFLE